jgi:hypothetical protein
LEVTKRRGSRSSSSKMWIHFPTKIICFLRTPKSLALFCCHGLPPSLTHHIRACACCKINCNFCFSSVPSLPHLLTHNRVICLLPNIIATRVFSSVALLRNHFRSFCLLQSWLQSCNKIAPFFFPSVALTHSDQSMCLSQNWNFYFLLVALVYHIKAKLLVAKLQALELTSETDCSSSVA